jgi:hypothetical protein
MSLSSSAVNGGGPRRQIAERTGPSSLPSTTPSVKEEEVEDLGAAAAATRARAPRNDVPPRSGRPGTGKVVKAVRFDPLRDIRVHDVSAVGSRGLPSSSSSSSSASGEDGREELDDSYEEETARLIAAGEGGQVAAHRAIVESLRRERALRATGGSDGHGGDTQRREGGGGVRGNSRGGFSSSSSSTSLSDRHADLQLAHQEELAAQDAALDMMAANLDRLGEVSGAIHTELAAQGRVLSDVEERVDAVEEAVKEATKKVKEIVDKNGGPKWCGTIVVLSLVLAVLTYIALFT